MRRPGERSTPAGEHRPVLLDEVLEVLKPADGAVVVDCTLGWAGHSAALLERVGPEGKLIAMDLDAENLSRARERLEPIGHPFSLHHRNFAGIEGVLGSEGVEKVDAVLADLGMSSMQVDDAQRGFSFMRDGPLDMRMDRTRGKTAAQLLATISEEELAEALATLGDEPAAKRIAAAIVAGRAAGAIERTGYLTNMVLQVTGAEERRSADWSDKRPKRYDLRPLARVYQTLRILVNRELANLEHLLRILPTVLKPGGRTAIISFHSGEDRRVKRAFRDGLRMGVYSKISEEAVRPTEEECERNPRSRSAKMRWAIRSTE